MSDFCASTLHESYPFLWGRCTKIRQLPFLVTCKILVKQMQNNLYVQIHTHTQGEVETEINVQSLRNKMDNNVSSSLLTEFSCLTDGEWGQRWRDLMPSLISQLQHHNLIVYIVLTVLMTPMLLNSDFYPDNVINWILALGRKVLAWGNCFLICGLKRFTFSGFLIVPHIICICLCMWLLVTYSVNACAFKDVFTYMSSCMYQICGQIWSWS